MTTVTTWLKHLASALFACLLLASFVTPSVRTGLCAGDPAMAAMQVLAAEAAGQGDLDLEAFANQEEGAGEICLEGHCHHASPLIDGAVVQHAVLQRDGGRLVPPSLGMPPSLEPDSPSEPPRA
uniref:Uncharacterized protein n=1 Tax=Caulobacter sp. (strain K31) TaxID=366602 RepID=B0SUV1_CAUSK